MAGPIGPAVRAGWHWKPELSPDQHAVGLHSSRGASTLRKVVPCSRRATNRTWWQPHPSDPAEMRQHACRPGLELSQDKHQRARVPLQLCRTVPRLPAITFAASLPGEGIQENPTPWACLGHSLQPDSLGVNQYNGHFSHQVWERISIDAQLPGGICQQSPASTSHYSDGPGAHPSA